MCLHQVGHFGGPFQSLITLVLETGSLIELGHPPVSVLTMSSFSIPDPSAGIIGVHCQACFGVYVCARDRTQAHTLLKIVLIRRGWSVRYLSSLGSFFPQRWKFRGPVFRY